jgi:hypothetical protein
MYRAKYQGKYQPKNISKYRGDIHNIIYRSSWESKFMIWCDKTPSVIEWGSEIAVIPYVSPLDKKIHRYFVDFYLKVIDKYDMQQRYLVEVKPKQYTKPPKRPEKQTKKYLAEVFQYTVNEAKWKAATEFCLDRGWKFIILTEDDLLT